MWRNKKLIIIELLVVVVLAAVLGIAAVAHADDEDANQNNTTSFIDKVAEIYQAKTGTALDTQALEDAFVQAHQEIRTEARNEALQKLVEEGKITQEQADEFKAWLDARPDIPGLFGQNNEHGMMFSMGRNHEGGMMGGFGLRSHDCWSD